MPQLSQYQTLYQESIADPAAFWHRQAETELDWFAPFNKAFEWNQPDYSWFIDGKINITHNCLDRHVQQGNGDRLAYIYNNERNEETKLTYTELLALVNKTANALVKQGVKKGDRVVLYMPLTLEQIALMLACARIGAVHSVVYAGFSAEALASRITDAGATIVCTATSTQKNGKRHDLLQVVREAVGQERTVEKVVVLQRSWDSESLSDNELDFNELIAKESSEYEPAIVDSSHRLFILYTSGTTGTPKGVVHTHGGYNLYSHVTMKHTFQASSDQVHWTAADTGWITGHSYIVYGPLSNGITSVVYEGSPIYPAPDRYWELVDRYRVASFYTAPTVIRLWMKEGEEYPAKYDLSSLQIIGSVGEPINPAAWHWYNEHIGKNRAQVVDTWWQTETGGHMLVTLPGITQKPGSAGLPFYGIQPVIVDEKGNEVTKPGVIGYLAITHPWPGALATCWNNHDRFAQYWTEFPNKALFYTGDVAHRDEDGYVTVLGRADDVINVAGVRIGTAEVESALVAHEAVAEAAVIGLSDEIKGERIKAFVSLNSGFDLNDALLAELKSWVKSKIGYIAVPEEIDQVSKLPKTRSGKIMRRVLKSKELGFAVGDTSTLED